MEKQININRYPAVVRLFAHVISYIFHPLFIPLFVTLFLVFIHPSYFTGYDGHNKLWLPLRVAYNTIFFRHLQFFYFIN
ncbi:MAG: hypothetical protein IPJ81_15695 [Chitinophagaceae bacterium]|nr:hypothetical protein [Chitinophagaceae bacterium]